MAKLGWFAFYPGDWLKDPQLRMATRSARGTWIDLLCYMFQSKSGHEVQGTIPQLAQLAGCSVAEMEDFLVQAERLRFADVTRVSRDSSRDVLVTISSRRMAEDQERRQRATDRQRRHRGGGTNTADLLDFSPGTSVECHASVTPSSRVETETETDQRISSHPTDARTATDTRNTSEAGRKILPLPTAVITPNSSRKVSRPAPRPFPPDYAWIQKFLAQQTLFGELEVLNALDDFGWWEDTARQMGGTDLTLEHLETCWAGMGNRFREKQASRPTVRGASTFIRSWIVREAEFIRKRERRQG